MKSNVGPVERWFRILVGAVAGYFLYSNIVTSPTARGLFWVIAIAGIVTGIFGYCPINQLFGVGRRHSIEKSFEEKPTSREKAA